MTKYTLYIGLNDQNTKTQLIKSAEALRIVKGYCWDYLDGATIQTGSGLYKHDDGGRVLEKTIIVTVNDYAENQKPAILEVCAGLKKELNQETILITAETLIMCDLV